METKDIIFPLAPLYKKKNIGYKQAKVVTFHPEGDADVDKPFVMVEYVVDEEKGKQEKVTYDYLINATGPKLAFDMTEGLLPGTNKAYSYPNIGRDAFELWQQHNEVERNCRNGF